jgi:hypothetical protein
MPGPTGGPLVASVAGLSSGIVVVTGLISALPGAVAPPDNKTTIDAALAAAVPGEMLIFPAPPSGQVYWTSGNHAVPTGVRCFGGAWNPNLPMFKVIATATPFAIFATYNWLNNIGTPDQGVIFDGISIDLNGVSAHGIVFMGKANLVSHCYIKNWRGAFAGIFTDAATQNATNTPAACQENQIYFNKLDGTATGNINGHHSIWVAKSAANIVSDSDIGFNILTGAGDDNVHLDNGGDWWIYRNHLYGNYQGSVIYINATSGDRIIDNQSDSFGFTNAGGVTYYCFRVIGSPGGIPPEIRGNGISSSEATHGAGAGNFVYFSYTTSGGSTLEVNLVDNTVVQATATSGTSTAYSFTNSGGGTLVANIRDYVISGTTIVTTPSTTGTVVIARTNTANIVKIATIIPMSTTAFTPMPFSDCTGTVPIAGGVAGTYTITMGPTTGAENSLITTGGAPASVTLLVPIPKVPAGWKVVVTVAGAAGIGTALFVSL